MDALGVVRQLRDLAKVPHNRPVIVRDQGCLPGLVLFLGNPDTVVVNVAVETISLLAECDEIRSTMWNELGLVISLNCLIDARGTAEDTRAACKEIITRISPAPLKAPVIAAPPRAASTKLPGKTVGDTSRTTTRVNQAGFFKSNVNTDARTITLHVKGLDDLHARKTLENALLQIRGIISFTVDMGKARAVVRARNSVSIQRLSQVISATGILDAEQVVRDDMGQERTLSFGAAPAGVAPSPEGKSMGYLDEDEFAPEELSEKAVAPWGLAGAAGGWLSDAASFVSQKLYW